MDPNACLEEIRNLASKLQDGSTTVDDFIDHGERLAELISALDEWITRGGFLPVQWSNRDLTKVVSRIKDAARQAREDRDTIPCPPPEE